MNVFKLIPLKIANIFFPYKFIGLENIPCGSAIIASNHFSAIDCVHFLNLSKDDVKFLAKKELFEKRFVSKLLSSYGALSIDRDNPDIKSMMNVMKILKNGQKIVIFPEGTRNKTGTTNLQEIKGGTVVFAVRAKCPIVPVMLMKKPRLFVKTKIIIGKPFELSEYYNKKLSDADINDMAKIVYDKMKEQQNILFNMYKRNKE